MEIDPTAFLPTAVAPETAAFNEQLRELIAAMPPVTDFTPDEVRAARAEGRSIFGEVVHSDLAENRTIPGPAGPLTLRVLVPDRVAGVFLHIHGGGWVLGAADMQDPFLEALARAANVAVISVEYRLAPEHPYPAANDDCEAAATWLVEHAPAEFGTNRLVIGGESAGAHLAATTLLRMRGRRGSTGFVGANLVYGAYDLAQTPSATNWTDGNLVLDPEVMAWFGDHYLGETGAHLRDPDVSPLYADLHDMPPALFTVGTADPLLDDTLFMAMRWIEYGNDAELAIYPGGSHAFDAFPIPIAQQARDRMHEFVAGLLP